MYPKQDLDVVFTQPLVQAALVFPKRRAPHKEHREGAQPRTHPRIADVLPLAGIGKMRKGVSDPFRNAAEVCIPTHASANKE